MTLRACLAATRDVLGEDALHAVSPRGDSSHDDRDWIPVDLVVSLCERLWDGPMAHNHATLRAWTDRMLDHGFGRVRRVFLSIATPASVVRRAGELWRGEFSDGRLVAYSTSETSARVSLHEHVFLETELMRDVVAESYRYALELAGGKGARETHAVRDNGVLVVELNW